MSLLRRLVPWGSSGAASKRETSAVPLENVAGVLAAASERAAEGHLASALAHAEHALQLAPEDPVVHGTVGSILFEWGRFWEARAELELAVHTPREKPTWLIQLGWACLWTGAAVEAESWMRRAAAAAPGDWKAHFGLGKVLRTQRRLQEALTSFRAALERVPDNEDCLAEIVGCHTDMRQIDDAERATEYWLAAHPQSIAALGVQASIRLWQDRFDEANAIYDRIAASDAAREDPTSIPLDAGFALRESGRTVEALAFYERHLPLRPDPNAQIHYAFTLLTTGRLREGFDQFEHRWMIAPFAGERLRVAKPLWRGQPLRGKKILVVGEQGYGDIIHFMRYLPLLAGLGSRMAVLMKKPMPELFAGLDGVEEVLQFGDPLPKFDYHVAVMSLPGVFGTTIDSIPAAVPYIRVDPERRARWRARLGARAKRRVGLVWAGGPDHLRDRYRSTSLEALRAVLAVKDLCFVSLQKGLAAEQIARASAGVNLLDFGPELGDLADTAAVVDELDLVIGVDTAVVHLAGALAKPVWTLIARPSDWRWLEGRNDSPWYPTMRLFRQSTPGDWGTVIEEVARELRGCRDSFVTPAAPPSTIGFAPESLPRAGATAGLPGLCAVTEARNGIFQHVPERSASERAVAWYGEDLQGQLDLLAGLVAPGSTILEAGGGIGTHTLGLAALVGAAGHLLVSEPRPALNALLRTNLAANGISFASVLATTLTGARPRKDDSIDDANATVDQLRLKKLDWLKIDESTDPLTVVAGAAESLWSLRPALFAAVADQHQMHLLASRVRDFGYHCWRVDTPRFAPGNFNRRDDDIFGGEVALAVLGVPEESRAFAVPDNLAALN